MFKPNEGSLDRTIRIVLGIVLLGLSFTMFTGTIQTIGFVVGTIALLTGLIGFCALYKILGISTK